MRRYGSSSVFTAAAAFSVHFAFSKTHATNILPLMFDLYDKGKEWFFPHITFQHSADKDERKSISWFATSSLAESWSYIFYIWFSPDYIHFILIKNTKDILRTGLMVSETLDHLLPSKIERVGPHISKRNQRSLKIKYSYQTPGEV